MLPHWQNTAARMWKHYDLLALAISTASESCTVFHILAESFQPMRWYYSHFHRIVFASHNALQITNCILKFTRKSLHRI
jgi:hypothetical protein